MFASLTIAFLVTLSWAVTTYLFDEKASPGVRLCTGACLGLPALGLVGFVIASFIGFTEVAVLLSTAVCALPLLTLVNEEWRNKVTQDLNTLLKGIRRFFLHPSGSLLGYFFFYLVIGLVLWQVFSRAMIENEGTISTGLLNNFGDLPFHLSVITGFAFGNNFPPEDPTYAGVRFTYPFISDFVSAIFVKCGANLRHSLLIENMMLGVSFVGLLHRWALVLLRDRLAAILTPLLVLLNGGFGWVLVFNNAMTHENGLLGALRDLPPSLTVIPQTTWRWGNAISALLVPQRGFLMGLPLAVIVFTQWWLANDSDSEQTPSRDRPPKKKRHQNRPHRQQSTSRFPVSVRRMIAAGIAAGLLPLVHAHSFVVVMVMGACIALLMRRWRDWIAFFVAASVIAIPQLMWSTANTAVSASSFFAWEIGWDHGKENPIWFWFKNTGLFIPLILVAILWRGESYLIKKRLLLFYLPFTLCFIVPNFLKMAPWVWDNIKILFYWWLASAPLVALLLARLWRQGLVRQLIGIILFVSLTLAGALEVAGIAVKTETKYDIFDAAGTQFAELLKEQTPPRSLILHAPVHNHPVFLSGRRSLMGYPGHIWTHGLEFVQREREVKSIYSGGPNAEALLRRYNIEYVVVGPLERLIVPVNDQFFSRYQKVGEIDDYRLFKIR